MTAEDRAAHVEREAVAGVRPEWRDSPEKVAWRALIPEAAAKIANFYTPGEQVGEGLAEVLAVEVLSVAFRHCASVLTRADALATELAAEPNSSAFSVARHDAAARLRAALTAGADQ